MIEETKVNDESPQVIELVYDSDAQQVIADRWPDAEFIDASDFIHVGRFEARIPATEDEFYPFIIAEGFGSVCLGLMIRVQTGEHGAVIDRWILEAKEMARNE